MANSGHDRTTDVDWITHQAHRMTPAAQARYEARTKIIKAMAHPTRLFLIDELSKNGEKCVRELTEMVGADMSTVSKHLAILREAGLVRTEKRGSQVYYRLGQPQILDFLGSVESVLLNNTRRQQQQLSR